MSIAVFFLLTAICLGLIYVVHKYFGKEQFYLLGIIYSILSFVLSFKLVNILGVDINANIIFSSGLFLMLYYFVNRYNEKESRKFIFTVITVTLMCICFLIVTAVMTPSIYDKMSILYPFSLCVSLFLSEYCFIEMKKEDSKKNIKTIFTIFGITFIDIALFIYFSYAFIIKFDTAVGIAIDNYLIKVCIMIVYVLIVNKLFMVRKVK